MRLSENAGCDNASYARFGLRRVYAHAMAAWRNGKADELDAMATDVLRGHCARITGVRMIGSESPQRPPYGST
jgi:hypothetical protein